MEVTLKEASLLCRKSEKTLRRKIDAGLLGGRREPLEFGGFMWLIDVESLDELYPGSRPSQLPQLFVSPELPQVRLKNRADEENAVDRGLVPQRELVRDETGERQGRGGHDLVDDEDEDEDGEEWNARQSFFDYILEENRGLKSELKLRDTKILHLNERAFVLERALGEQEGKAATQSRVLEWFQGQESDREKQRAENDRRLLEAGAQTTAPQAKPYLAALAGVSVTVVLFLIFVAAGLINFQT